MVMLTDTATTPQEPTPMRAQYKPELQPKQDAWVVQTRTAMVMLILTMHSQPKRLNGAIPMLTGTEMRQVDSKETIALQLLVHRPGTDLDAWTPMAMAHPMQTPDGQ
jgi:hypothetical protein